MPTQQTQCSQHGRDETEQFQKQFGATVLQDKLDTKSSVPFLCHWPHLNLPGIMAGLCSEAQHAQETQRFLVLQPKGPWFP